MPEINSGDVVADVLLVERLVCSLSVSCGSYRWYGVVPCWRGRGAVGPLWRCYCAMRCGDVLPCGDGIGWCRGDGMPWNGTAGMLWLMFCLWNALCAVCQFLAARRMWYRAGGAEGPWGCCDVATVAMRCGVAMYTDGAATVE